MKYLSMLLLLACATAEPGATHASTVTESAVASTGRVDKLFPPPRGSARASSGSFAQYLQGLMVLEPGTPITTHDGAVVRRAGRVIDLPMVRGDLQQCADTAIRLRAQWLKDNGHPVLFHATSGDPLPWARYASGQKPVVRNDRIHWVAGGDKSWDSYLRAVFMWAGTASLKAYDSAPVSGAPKPGDLLVDPGFPGHAVVLLDVASDGDSTYILVAQGFMPAQTAHIVVGPHAGWWRWEPGVELPVWRFGAEHLRRFPAP